MILVINSRQIQLPKQSSLFPGWASARCPLLHRQAAEPVHKKYEGELKQQLLQLTEIRDEVAEWDEKATEIYSRIAADLKANMPDLSDAEAPASEAPGRSKNYVLFDSGRDYFTQIDHYKAWQAGG